MFYFVSCQCIYLLIFENIIYVYCLYHIIYMSYKLPNISYYIKLIVNFEIFHVLNSGQFGPYSSYRFTLMTH